MQRNHHKTLKAKFDKFAVGYGPVVSAILGALRTTLFGQKPDIEYTSPVQNWDTYVNAWRDLPHDQKVALLNAAVENSSNWLSSTRKATFKERSIKKRTKPLLKSFGGAKPSKILTKACSSAIYEKVNKI